MNDDFHRLLYNYLVESGLNETAASYLNLAILLVIALVVAYFLDLIIWKILRSVSLKLARKSKTNFDNFLVANRVPRYVAHIIPLSILVELVPFGFIGFDYAAQMVLKFLNVLFVILALYLVKNIFRSINDFLKTKSRFRDKPMDSYIQVFMIFAWVVGIFTIFAIITEIQVWKFFTALGAGSAVILLIFKDSILGLVASIQVSINDMVRIGDWISFDKFGADGNVVEITLATVKVQNFDNTITTIPTYALISDSFKNWRGMQESGGRRIKRALIISQKSIRFLSDADIEEFQKIQLIQPYLNTRAEQINTYNTANNIDKELAINGRNLTNIGVFRKYVNDYLQSHSAVNKGMTLMVRQLAPTPQGIPLEVYAFSSDKRWENYEYVMADIFDHLLAALPYFQLQVYEIPVPIATS
ncbi:mechanosensitive ion channel family protein [Maribacter sp. 1_MG-2023]|uniref:mechanosensitive ion channel family protein n=1 Tax=Maribacter sp. 1_MG-2023 TaxID=3062677 RepID=UPI0026E1F836|nr:mechanosensitive ion channel domain-containing protein [Maribacter sp. 1_MG-2023]MDO6470682.1 mechanosensitive ion channel [Maribacter sp. 1_MG-2023]